MSERHPGELRGARLLLLLPFCGVPPRCSWTTDGSKNGVCGALFPVTHVLHLIDAPGVMAGQTGSPRSTTASPWLPSNRRRQDTGYTNTHTKTEEKKLYMYYRTHVTVVIKEGLWQGMIEVIIVVGEGYGWARGTSAAPRAPQIVSFITPALRLTDTQQAPWPHPRSVDEDVVRACVCWDWAWPRSSSSLADDCFSSRRRQRSRCSTRCGILWRKRHLLPVTWRFACLVLYKNRNENFCETLKCGWCSGHHELVPRTY